MNNIQNQISNYTEYDRTPEIFNFVKNNEDTLKILSFGCSFGLEPNVLSDKYFKKSIIHAIDIDIDIIKTNIENNINSNIIYYNDINLLDNDYDIIFCMSVLCRWPEDQHLYSFNIFQKTLLNINKHLKVGGNLVIYNSQYLLEETSLNDYYDAINTQKYNTGFVTKYTKDFKVFTDIYSNFIFKKKKEYIPNYAVMWANTENLGDDIQTLAAINYLKNNNINKYTLINREELSDYTGSIVHLLMNGWFMHNVNKFPPSPNIIPIFISFHCYYEELIKNNVSYFKIYQPIGCRDIHTMELFKKYDIDAYFTGCLTLTFNKEDVKTDKIYYVDINTCNYIPYIEFDKTLYNNAIEIKHDIYDKAVQNDIEKRLLLANDLLDMYRKAKLVITTRLHCVLPCRAFRTNVKFIHTNYNTDKRFSGLENILCGSDKIEYTTNIIEDSLINIICDNFNDCLL